MLRNGEKLVSVIIPVFNGAGFIAESIESVRRQTHAHFECIIIDDGSTDNTAAVIQKWIDGDRRFSYFYQPNQGLSAARNSGLLRATGDFIQFLDADDVLLPTKLEEQLEFMSRAGSRVSYTDYGSGTSADIFKPHRFRRFAPLQSKGKIIQFVARWETSLVIPPHSFLFSAGFFRENGIQFDTLLPNHEDFDCWLNILRVHPEVEFLNKKLCIYRITDGSMSSKMKSMGEGFLKVLEKQIQLPDEPPGLRKVLFKKRLAVLKGYNRIDLMTFGERILLSRHILSYYFKRIMQKTGLIKVC